MEDSIFTKIIKGEIPSHKIYEDDKVIAFLTIRPVTDGHTLVVPKEQIDSIWELDPEAYSYLWETARTIAKHLQESMEVDRVGVVVKGFEVPHTHIHLIPVNKGSGIDFDPNPIPALADEKHLHLLAEKLHF
jgi:histidine triad (HIT) family protein